MMKLTTDSFNLNTLKIIASAEFCNEEIHVEKIERKGNYGKISQLPVLTTKHGFEYTSSNTSCWYIFTKSGQPVDPTADAWLKWEFMVFQPHVLYQIESSKVQSLSDDLTCDFKYLNTFLEGKDAISQCGYGIADIVVWANFYVLDHIYGVKEVVNFKHIRKWYTAISKREPLSRALNRVFGDEEYSSLKTSLSYNRLPLPIATQKYFVPVPVAGFLPHKCNGAVQKPEQSVKVDEDSKEHVVTAEEITFACQSWSKGVQSLPPLKHKEPIKLPKEGENNILITSALPYVNNVPHLGNIIGAVLSADSFARYCRLRNFNTLYVCGTDEYGTATETKAIELGVTPREICDKFNKIHSDIYEWFNISFDYFGRTTTEQQTSIAQDIFNRLHSRGLLIEDTVEQLYCENCQRFLADRFVEGTCPFCQYEEARGDQCDKCDKLINAPELKNPACKVCKSTPHLKTSKHLFLDLPKLEPELKQYLDNSHKTGCWSNTAKVISSSWLKEGLKPRCITRDLKWGTPVPLEGFTDKVFYVWFDAPIGYLSITANYTKDWEKWWKQPNLVKLYQFMAKDNVPFHSIIFPACQLGAKDNYTMINTLAATEYLNYEEMKFSKSRGVGVFGDDAKNTGIPSDIWRFYLLYMRPESQDSFFSWNDLMLKNNSELLNNLGNFINRALMFIDKNFDGVIQKMTLKENDKIILAQVNHELQSYINHMDRTRLREAIRPMLNISRLGNQYIQAHKPWELIKGNEEDKCVAGTILSISANIACLLCTLMEPYMPETSKELKNQLNTKPEFHILIPEFICLLTPGHKLGKPVPLFKKLDQELINKLKETYAGRQTPEKTVEKKEVKVQSSNQAAPASGADIEKLNASITEQGNKVRELKARKAEKSEIDKEVAVLLDLKKKLCILKGEELPIQAKGKSKSKSKK